MDNRVFDVNGKGDGMLRSALTLAFQQDSQKDCEGMLATEEHGLILFAYGTPDVGVKFPCRVSADVALAMCSAWLDSPVSKNVKLSGWHKDEDHDGSNSLGWRVYVEDWGHVGNHRGVICAVSPSYLWHGK